MDIRLISAEDEPGTRYWKYMEMSLKMRWLFVMRVIACSAFITLRDAIFSCIFCSSAEPSSPSSTFVDTLSFGLLVESLQKYLHQVKDHIAIPLIISEINYQKECSCCY